MDENRRTMPSRNAASRPSESEFIPQSSGTGAYFTEIPLSSLRRTPNSGRPDNSGHGRPAYTEGRKVQAAGGSLPSQSSSSSANRRQCGEIGGDGLLRRGSSRSNPAGFTEIQWDGRKISQEDIFRASQANDRPPASSNMSSVNPPVKRPSGMSAGAGAQFYEASRPRQPSDIYRNYNSSRPFESAGYSEADTSRRQPYVPRSQRGTESRKKQSATVHRRSLFQRAKSKPESKSQPYQTYNRVPYRPASSNNPGGSVSSPIQSCDSFSVPRVPDTAVRHVNGRVSPPRKRGIHPFFYAAGAVLVLIIVMAAVLISRGVRNNTHNNHGSPSGGALITPAPVPTATVNDVLAEPTPSPIPTATPAPTPTPSGAKAVLSGGRIVPADWGPVVLESGSPVYNSFFDRSCMIGNSLVEGFFMYSGLTNIRYIYNTGATINRVVGVMDLSPIALNEDGYYDSIYLMFGLNEIGTGVDSFITSYISVIDYIRQYQTKATIYVISVTPVTESVDKDENEVQSMERIRLFNESLKEMCQDTGCWYLDIYSMLLDDNGYLSADYAYAGDGKHFEKSGYVAWADYMKTHIVTETLLR